MAVLAAMVFASACTMNELLEPTSPSDFGDDVVTISPRISHFADCNVATRSPKEGDEGKVTSMAMALFPIVDGTIQPSVFYKYNADGNMLFVLDRNEPPFVDAEGNPLYQDKEFVMYVIANMQGTGIPETNPDYSQNTPQPGIGWTPADFVSKCHTITGGSCFEQIGEKGLPMIGMLGDRFSAHGDGKTFIFMPTKSGGNDKGLPTVDGTPSDNLEIPMRSLYAKVSFTIEVDSDQEVVGHAAPRFDLSGYQVYNAPSSVYLSRDLNVDDETDEYNAVDTSEFHNVETQGIYAQGAIKAIFHCYVPERYLTPETLPSAYTYDFGENGGAIVGYENIPAELKKYAQRFKPELVSDEQKATYVAIKGKFTDHQKHVFDVTYRIYLGKDNYGDFNIIRNTHYNNILTIRGIDNADDQSAGYDPDNVNHDAPISIDHRVTVDRTTPLVVGLRRETLLDAHFEVRPLRLHLSGGDPATNPTRATITLMKAKNTDPALSTWIGMELSGNDSKKYITGTNTPSDGKRKYFTKDLISSISGNTSLTVEDLGYNANKTIWLYVDENTTTASRSAILRIHYDYQGAVPEDYVIIQHGLHEINHNDKTYYIERFEEYLYNYDVEDLFGQTREDGMPWGLDGKQLSNEHDSFICDEDNTYWTSYIQKNPLKYDFYIGKHDTFALGAGGTVHNFAGQEFTREIYTKSKGGVKNLTMAEQASGAVEYCYNRNKRNSDGTIAAVEWYLPSADELEDIIIAGYSSYVEFQENYYWTSQPAYIRNAFYYQYNNDSGSGNGNVRDTYAFIVYEDNPNYARATKVVHGNDGFTYAESGLNETPKETHEMDDNCKSKRAEVLGYFYKMPAWYRYKGGRTTTQTFTTDEHFDVVIDGEFQYVSWNVKKRYHIHLGHLYDMTQEGYQLRTKNNRVRCAYRKIN